MCLWDNVIIRTQFVLDGLLSVMPLSSDKTLTLQLAFHLKVHTIPILEGLKKP